MASVRLRQIAKKFGGVTALENLDLDIADGELLTLLGPSGCGKTTTLRIIAGFVEPSNGTIFIGDQDVTRLAPQHRGIGMVFQDYALFPHLTLAENIAFGLKERRIERGAIGPRVTRLLELIQLADLSDRFPAELSGGQQQRVALARAVAFPPHVLLMDEPLGALDQKLREAMQTELRRIQRDLRITTVFVTHDQSEAMKISDRIAVMNGGKVDQLGTAREIYKTPHTKFVADFIGKINFIPGRAGQPHGAYLAVDTPAGRILAPSVRPHELCAPLTVGVRPEDLRLIEPSDAVPANLISGKLEECTYMGNLAHINIDLGSNIRILLETRPTGAALEPGSAVRVGWRPEETMVFAE
jgi:putative spermidine/putrescine transport system ATP-binding protein